MTSPERRADGSFTVRSAFACSSLACDPPIARRIAALTAPYFDVGAHPCDGGWTTVAGEEPSTGAEEVPVAALGETPIVYAIDHGERRVFHLSPAGDEWAAQSLLRATRAIHRSEAQRAGMLFLHGGLVRLGDLGIALVGGSRAGKTSLILAAVLNGIGRMVSNDDAGLLAAGTEVRGFGWPRSISIRLDTLDLLFGPARAVDIRASLTHPANETILSLRQSGVEKHGTALVYPYEYTALLDAPMLAGCRVDAVVFLSLADGESDRFFGPVPQPVAGELLAKSTLREPNKHLNVFGDGSEGAASAVTAARVGALPAFRFRYAFDRVRDEADLLATRLVAHV